MRGLAVYTHNRQDHQPCIFIRISYEHADKYERGVCVQSYLTGAKQPPKASKRKKRKFQNITDSNKALRFRTKYQDISFAKLTKYATFCPLFFAAAEFDFDPFSIVPLRYKDPDILQILPYNIRIQFVTAKG